MSDQQPTSAPFRLVALDIDGTLLDDHDTLTPRTLATVHEVVARGVTVALATSRRYTGAVPIAKALDLHGPLILYDGAQTREYPGGEIVSNAPLGRRTARLAIKAIGAQNLRPIAQYADLTGERLLVGPPLTASAHEREYVERFTNQITELPLEKLASDPAPLVRLVAFGPLELLRLAAESIASLPCGHQLLAHGNYGTAELSVFARGASKGAALLRLAAHLGIPQHSTLAIGDGLNDISMLSIAGLGVAMGNASPEVRAIATAFTASNAEDGAAAALKRYILHPN